MNAANRDLALRVASGVVLFPLVVWVIWHGGAPFAFLLAAAAALAAGEAIGMLSPIGLPEVYGTIVAALFPLAPWAHGGHYPAWTPVALAFAGMGLLALHLRTPLAEVPRRASAVALAWVWVGPVVASLVSLRLLFGFGWVVMALVATWANDTFAYFAGRFFGRHQMAERISPRKTWEGFAGGAVGGVLGALAVRAIDPAGDLGRLGAAGTIGLGLGASVLGPLGDLAESMVKRAAGVKDSGRLIPGHGGLLDRIDALLFVVPWVWLWAHLSRG